MCLWLEHLGQEFRKKLAKSKLNSSRSSEKCGIEYRGREMARGRKERAPVGGNVMVNAFV